MEKELDVLVRKFYALEVLAHVSHENVALTTKSYAQHVALGEFYDKVGDMKDRLIEYLIGENRIQKVSVPILEIGADLVSEAKATAQMFCDIASASEDEALENMAGEFEESVGKLSYLFLFK